MQDKREIGYCTDRLEKVQYLKRVIKYNYRTSDKKLKNIYSARIKENFSTF